MAARLNHPVVRRILIGTGVFILLVILIGMLTPVLFEKQVKEACIRSLNRNLATEVVVDQDDITLQSLRHFPFASVSFHDVRIRESFEGSQDFFLAAKNIHLLFNWWDMLRKDYTITQVIAEEADIRLVTKKDGRINYRFWKTSDEEDDQNEFVISLENIRLDQVHLTYLDERQDIDWQTTIGSGRIKGLLSGNEYDLDISADLDNEHFFLGTDSYFPSSPVRLSTRLFVQQDVNLYRFSNTSLRTGENEFSLDGAVQIGKVNELDLKIKGESLKIDELLRLLPQRVASRFSGWASKGDLGIEGTVKGKQGKDLQPGLDFTFIMQEGELYVEGSRDKLKNVSLTGRFTNGNQHLPSTSSVEVPSFNAAFAGEQVTGFLFWNNLRDPDIDLSLTGKLPASIVLPMLQPQWLESKGVIVVEDLKVKGNLREIRTQKRLDNPPSGSIRTEDVSFEWFEEKCRLETDILADGSRLKINRFAFEGMGSEINGEGEIDRWTSLLDGSGPHYVKGSLNLDELDVDALESIFSQTGSGESSATVPPSDGPALWEKLSGSIDLRIGHIRQQNLELDNVRAELYFSLSMVSIRDIEGDTRLGNVRLNAIMRRMPSRNIQVEIAGLLQKVDMTELFKGFDNFGQTELTYSQLEGVADVLIENLSFQTDPNGSFIPASLYTLCDITIRDGELTDFAPLESLSGYIDVKELKKVKFSELNNQIVIENEVIYIPVMDVKSSALNLTLTGSHSFSNEIDYSFKVRLGELLGRKFLGKQNDPNTFEREKNGGVNIYVHMTGTVDDPVIEVNPKGGKNAFEEVEDRNDRFLDIFKDHDKEKDDRRNDDRDQTPTDTLEFIDWDDD